ncbi:MAG: glycoside hydrolase family 16 protein, partial [Fidelibacterota bacterium]
ENSYIENGRLIIRALKENYNGANYTSARLVSADKGEWQYGRFDIRAKLPMGQGTWPAIWMLGSNIQNVGWPECGEIDIMEHVNNEESISSSIHSLACYHSLNGYPGACPDYNMSCPDGCPDHLPNTYWTTPGQLDDWHVYGMIRTENNITFTVDDVPYMTVNRPINSGDEAWPFDQDFFFILNLAIGGIWPGDPDDSIFPITFEIDYVRVYIPE